MPGGRALIVAAQEPRAGAEAEAFASDVAGRTLVECQLAALVEAGIRQVTITASAPVPDAVRRHFADRAVVLEGEPDGLPGSLHALWRACGTLDGGTLVVHGSAVFTPRLVHHLVQHPAPDALVYAPGRSGKDSAVGVRLAGPYVVDIGRHVPGTDVAGESVGLVKLGPEGVRRLVPLLRALVEDAEPAAPAWRAFARLARTWPLVAIDTGGHSWARLDTPTDITHAGPFARRAASPQPPDAGRA